MATSRCFTESAHRTEARGPSIARQVVHVAAALAMSAGEHALNMASTKRSRTSTPTSRSSHRDKRGRAAALARRAGEAHASEPSSPEESRCHRRLRRVKYGEPRRSSATSPPPAPDALPSRLVFRARTPASEGTIRRRDARRSSSSGAPASSALRFRPPRPSTEAAAERMPANMTPGARVRVWGGARRTLRSREKFRRDRESI